MNNNNSSSSWHSAFPPETSGSLQKRASIIIPILQMGKQKLREGKWLAQGHLSSAAGSGIKRSSPDSQCSAVHSQRHVASSNLVFVQVPGRKLGKLKACFFTYPHKRDNKRSSRAGLPPTGFPVVPYPWAEGQQHQEKTLASVALTAESESKVEVYITLKKLHHSNKVPLQRDRGDKK